ncbi:RidA family protein [Saccharopolyspora sp. NFXS83]|uniref:RidA family protein n=1 Tax=Saccharopolyspora sp. NFXS83 TaxID=2993560 RepID=UPI00224B71B8|nr:RidA family protein [Saccharopolyspora sp. NFXS83]MCX2730580.1 RidA family protein [Saccharopolyspora sp. NFXS83]
MDRVNPPELARPSGFSHAVVAEGRMVLLAGQTGTDSEGRIADAGVLDQFDRALANLVAALRAAGGSPDDLAQLTIYLVDVEAYRAAGRELGAVWKRHVGAHYPATAAVGVTRLWDRAALVELQGIAVLDVEPRNP